jgi:hypothetical protein
LEHAYFQNLDSLLPRCLHQVIALQWIDEVVCCRVG